MIQDTLSDLFMKVTILDMLSCVVHWAFYFARSNDPFSTVLMPGTGRLNDLNCNVIHGHVWQTKGFHPRAPGTEVAPPRLTTMCRHIRWPPSSVLLALTLPNTERHPYSCMCHVVSETTRQRICISLVHENDETCMTSLACMLGHLRSNLCSDAQI
jgi:hypothetical protein